MTTSKKKGTHQKINSAINKYETIISRAKPMDDEEATRVEMSFDFVKVLKNIRESFLDGE